jgi:hypothetical protein
MTTTGALLAGGRGGLTTCVLDDGGVTWVVRGAGCVVVRRVEDAGVLGAGELLGVGSGDELLAGGDVCGGVGDPDVLHADSVRRAVASTAKLRRRFTRTR